MPEPKTRATEASVDDFIRKFAESVARQHDAFQLVDLMREVTGHEPRIWGTSIIGFGEYLQHDENSRRDTAWPVLSFSPRKAAISLYIFTDAPGQRSLLEKLGKYKMGKACIYVKKLADIDLEILRELMVATVSFLGAGKELTGDSSSADVRCES